MPRSNRTTTNLVPDPRVLVGRSAELQSLGATVDERRLTTIVGPGGMGKTRLARALAGERIDSYSAHGGGGVWFCDLSVARSAQDIVSALAASLGARGERAGRGLGATLARLGRVLIVLDNFDRLVAHASETVGAWMMQAPSARFLVTSRAPLELPEEHRFLLSPLAVDDAVQLFGRCARLVAPGFDPDADGESIRAIVEAIDRMPLAIELAARRIAVLSPAELRARLDRPLEVLTGGREVERHRSMRRTIEDSVALLDERMRRLFAAASYLRNGFTLGAAEAILGDVVVPTAELLDGFDALARASLLGVLQRPGEPARYAFFETIRDVAEELAQRAPENDVPARIVAHYATVAATARGSALTGDLDNLLLAHRHAVELARSLRAEPHALAAFRIARAVAPILAARGQAQLSARLFEEALVALDESGSQAEVVRAEIHLARGSFHRELGATEVALEAFRQGLALAEPRDPSLAAVALTRLGEASDLAGDTGEARASFDRARALLEQTPRDEVRLAREAELFLRLGHAARREGDLARARSAIARAIEWYDQLGDDEGLAWALYERAVVTMFGVGGEEALAHFDEGLRVAKRADVPVVVGALTTARGCALQDLGRAEEALAHHAQAVRAFRDAGSRYREASALYYLATTYVERGAPSEAITVLHQAKERLRGVGAARYEALIAGCLSTARVATGELELAEEALREAEAAGAKVKNEPCLVANLRIHRLVYELARSPERSRADARREAAALVSASSNDDSRFALRVLERGADGGLASSDALVVERGGGAFRLAGGAAVVRVPERSPMRRILDHLALRRVESPGEVSTIDEIIAIGWPGEKVAAAAARNRAWVALANLRRMGLRGVLLQGGGGYALSQGVVVRIENKVE